MWVFSTGSVIADSVNQVYVVRLLFYSLSYLMLKAIQRLKGTWSWYRCSLWDELVSINWFSHTSSHPPLSRLFIVNQWISHIKLNYVKIIWSTALWGLLFAICMFHHLHRVVQQWNHVDNLSCAYVKADKTNENWFLLLFFTCFYIIEKLGWRPFISDQVVGKIIHSLHLF